jgi:hypothetical protein
MRGDAIGIALCAASPGIERDIVVGVASENGKNSTRAAFDHIRIAGWLSSSSICFRKTPRYCAPGSRTEAWMKAECQCGKLSVGLPGPTPVVVACHCVDCQRRSGSPFGVLAYYAADQLTITGEAKRFVRPTTASGDVFECCFSPDCGSTVYVKAGKHPSGRGYCRSSLPGAGTLCLGAVYAPVGDFARRGSALPAGTLVRCRFSYCDAGKADGPEFSHQRS